MEIQDTTSFEQLQAFFKENSSLIKDEDNNFMRSLTKAWIKKIISQKLIEFHEEELVQKIDAINPNQSMYKICKEICTIILNDASESISQTHSDSDNSNEFSWLDYYLTYDTYL